MYIVTGGAGFIGSAFVWKLNQLGIDQILVVDNLGSGDKWLNLRGLRYLDYLHKDDFIDLVLEDELRGRIEGIVHMGACSSTTEMDVEYLLANNYKYTRVLAEYSLRKGIRFVYASSAATYGDGAFGYSDDHSLIEKFKPLNPYGYSKQLFDLWALRTGALDKIAGLKFFNVYGPNEYHKGDMRSMVHKAWGQAQNSGAVKLFKSYRQEFSDGGQQRDFVYVKDCLDVIWWLLGKPAVNGIFNLGSGKAQSWNELVSAVFASLGQEKKIEYIEMPEILRPQYQYFTQAEMNKLNAAGCPVQFTSLDKGVADYVKGHLCKVDPRLSA